MERLIIKEPYISPPDNQENGKSLIVLYVVNVVSKDFVIRFSVYLDYLIIERRLTTYQHNI
jgi:hypothetical protein